MKRQVTFASSYVALGLLALTLLIGPANLILRRRNPASSYLRRDVGTWTAAMSVVHVIFGLRVHGGGRLRDFLMYFVTPDGGTLLRIGSPFILLLGPRVLAVFVAQAVGVSLWRRRRSRDAFTAS